MLRQFLIIFILILPNQTYANGEGAGALSIVPGLGQASQGHIAEGFTWLGVIAGGLLLTKNESDQTIFYDLWMYNIYDAYKDGGGRAAKNNVFSNYFAAFNPIHLLDYRGDIPIAVQAASNNKSDLALSSDNKLKTPFYMAFIALGEEALFRGYFFPVFSNIFGTVTGAISSSLLFAASHGLYKGQSSLAFSGDVFLWRAFLGLIYSWQTYQNKNDLRGSIFSHTWVNVIHEYKRTGVLAGGRVGKSSNGIKPGKPNGIVLGWKTAF